MYFDALTTAAVGDELRARLKGGRVQNILQVDDFSVGMEIYAQQARHYLLLSATPQNPRVHLASDKFRRGVQQPDPLTLRLRRHLSGARLRAVTVPDWERVLCFDFESLDGGYRVIAECIERRGNILLVDEDDMILECIRRVGPQDNRVRLSLPGHLYAPPPPQIKTDPTGVTRRVLEGWIQADPDLAAWRMLVKHLAGFSPLLAREVVFRTAQDIDTPAGAIPSVEDLQAEIETVIMPLWERDWQPCIAEDEYGGALAFAPYRLTHLDRVRPAASISAAVEAFYGAPVGADAYNAAKKPVRESIQEAQDKLRRKLEALERSQQDPAELEHLRRSGELILAYQYTLKPGQTRFAAAYEVDGPEITVELDPALSPVENAQRYFKQYNKAKSANAGVPKLIAEVWRATAFLDQLALDLDLASNWPEIEEVRETLERLGYVPGPQKKRPSGGKAQPLRLTTDDGFVIWVGRNARQNDEVTFKRGAPEDLWLHARDVPGAHVIIKNDGRTIPDKVIEYAAALAARYSPKRGEAGVLVDVTRRKHVRKIKGAGDGMVTYRNETSVTVAPAREVQGA
ncbi:MAG: NFACT family protein [Anaerolineae bacterium]|nr:NFACT family protein [Anaerolineae bacterium]